MLILIGGCMGVAALLLLMFKASDNRSPRASTRTGRPERNERGTPPTVILADGNCRTSVSFCFCWTPSHPSSAGSAGPERM